MQILTEFGVKRVAIRSKVWTSIFVIVIVVTAINPAPSFGQSISWRLVSTMISASYPDVPSLATGDLSEALADSSANILLLDIRTQDEFEVSHLRNALRIDPENPDLTVLDSVDTERQIVLYCSVGYRSAGMTKRLRELGYKNAANLDGSIFKWANEGNPVYREDKEVNDVHPVDLIWGMLLNAELRTSTPR